jgi:hypothetical protein
VLYFICRHQIGHGHASIVGHGRVEGLATVAMRLLLAEAKKVFAILNTN